MKNIYSIIACLLLTASVWAQAPQKMSYQAVIRNSSNALITSKPVGMKISVLRGSTSGTAVYVETQRPTTNILGLVSLEIGSGTPVTGTFAGINWATGPYFIKTEADPRGGTDYTIVGTNELMSVPYALYAETAKTFTGNAATATKLAATKNINGVPFDGSADITIIAAAPDATTSIKGIVQLAGDLTGTAALPTIAANAVTTAKILDASVTDAKIATGISASKVGLGNVNNTTDLLKPISTATQTALDAKAALASPTFTGTVTAPTFVGALTGNAITATALATARTINGVAFDGTANITITAAAGGMQYFEKELVSDGENSIAITFSLVAFSKIYYNGALLRQNQWSGVGLTTLTLILDTRQNDKLTVTN